MALPPDDTNWDQLTRRLVAFALSGLRVRGLPAKVEDAEDVVHEAIAQIYSPDHKDWDPTASSLERFAGSVINGILQNRVRRATTHRKARVDDVASSAHAAPPSPIDGRLVAKALVSEILDRVSGNDVAFRVLVAMSEGVGEPRMIAEQQQVPVQQVYKARARIRQEAETAMRQHAEGRSR